MAEHAHAEAAPETTAAPTPLVALRGASQVQMIQRLQQTAGNRAVAAMIARKVTYDECSSSQQSQIGDAHTRGKEMAKIAIKKLRDYDGSSPAEVKTALKKHFNSESKWVAKIVANNLDHVVPQVDDTQYECHEKQEGAAEAEALWCIPWSDIKVFPLWYANKAGTHTVDSPTPTRAGCCASTSACRDMSRSWSDLSTEQRVGVVALGTFQVSLQIAALVDIRRRPAEQIKGRKATWVAVSFINTFGPLAYFKFGRRR